MASYYPSTHQDVRNTSSMSPITSPSRKRHPYTHKTKNRASHFSKLEPNVTISNSLQKTEIHHKHHPEYHFFSPKYQQQKIKHPRHRRKLSLDHREESYGFMKYIQYLDVEKKHNNLLPPKDDKKKTLILDLDETLVHCSTLEMEDSDFNFTAHFNRNHYSISGRLRPGVLEFLKAVSKDWEIVIFTASTSAYADQVCNIIDPTGNLIHHRLFRESCTNVEGNYIKDLSCLGRDLRKTILVDNSPHTFSLQVNNGIPIQSWYEDSNDTELGVLLDILNEIQHEDDVRTYIKEEFEVYKLIKFVNE